MNQPNLKAYLVNELDMTEGDGWAYHQGAFPVLLTAHLDTVHKSLPGRIVYTKTRNGDSCISSPNGIGGDDRCGVYMILKILEQIDCSVLFCEDEEVGSIGAGKFTRTKLCESLKGKFKYIIELDRANSNDAVYYDDDNKDFHEFIEESYWKMANGSWSDICELSPELEISSVNLSCGYYKQHTSLEYVMLNEMENNIKEVIKLLKRTDLNAEPFKFIEKPHIYSHIPSIYDNYWGWYDEEDTRFLRDDYYLEATVDPDKFACRFVTSIGKSKDEAWKNLFCENPSLCMNDVIDWVFY